MKSKKWSKGTPIKKKRYGHQCALVDDKIVIVGGRFENGGLNSVEIWKPNTGTIELCGMRVAIQYHAMIHYKQKLYIFGGKVNTNENDAMYLIDFATNGTCTQHETRAIRYAERTYQMKYAGYNPVVFNLPYGYLEKCKGMSSYVDDRFRSKEFFWGYKVYLGQN